MDKWPGLPPNRGLLQAQLPGARVHGPLLRLHLRQRAHHMVHHSVRRGAHDQQPRPPPAVRPARARRHRLPAAGPRAGAAAGGGGRCRGEADPAAAATAAAIATTEAHLLCPPGPRAEVARGGERSGPGAPGPGVLALEHRLHLGELGGRRQRGPQHSLLHLSAVGGSAAAWRAVETPEGSHRAVRRPRGALPGRRARGARRRRPLAPLGLRASALPARALRPGPRRHAQWPRLAFG
mmetsp:Transcript_41494/g.129297  ORF Transcript_41494/g.129297 Transcript_41494/m.129297 type:complete len:237 (+) Transcript_41494:225-935(+)